MELLRSKLELVVAKHLSKGSVYGFNKETINPKKLVNVKEVHDIAKESILIIYDVTLFGSARDGMVFTDQAIYWREMLGNSQRLDYPQMIRLDFDKEDMRETYYKLICDLRAELVKTSHLYQDIYQKAIEDFEKNLKRLEKSGRFRELIETFNDHEALYLKERDKSLDSYEILFRAYLEEKDLSKAEDQLKVLGKINAPFYKEAAKAFDRATREAEFLRLEIERLKAVETQDYPGAFLLLDKQKGLKIISDFEIDHIKAEIEKTKKSLLESDHNQLRTLVEKRRFAEAKEVIDHIYKIEPLYPLEREEILIMIYKYKLDEVQEAIRTTWAPELKAELEKIYQLHIETVYRETRQAAREGNYDYFKVNPRIWHYRDEYGMSALDYFALAGDAKGVLMALDYADLTFMETNLFGHNFVDLICLGGSLDILEKIQQRFYIKHVEKRIIFFETGQEGDFFSYQMTREMKKLELNEKLMAASHFRNIKNELNNQTNNHIDQVIRQIFSEELEEVEMHPSKDDFETSEDYRIRSRNFKRPYLNRTDFIEEYKRQNEPIVALIKKRLAEKTSYFIPRLSAWVVYKGKKGSVLENLDTSRGMLELLNLYFPLEKPRVEMGTYDPDRQVFYMVVDEEIKEMKVARRLAKDFRDSFDKLEFDFEWVIEGEQISKQCIYEWEDKKFQIVIDICHKESIIKV